MIKPQDPAAPATETSYSDHGHDRTATFLGLLAILLWSSTVALVRSLSEKAGPTTGGAAIYLISGILLTARCIVSKKPVLKGISRSYLFWCGSLFVFYTVSLMTALGLAQGRSESIVVGLLNYLWPALTILFSIPLLGNKPKPSLLPGILAGIAGIFLVLAGSAGLSPFAVARKFSANSTPYLLGIAAAMSWALYSNLAKRLGAMGTGESESETGEIATRKGGTGEGGVPLFTVTSGLALLGLAVMRGEVISPAVLMMPEALVLGVATALGYFFWDMAMRRGDMVTVAACSYITPFLSTLFSCIYLGVSIDSTAWAGCLLIVAGSILSRKGIVKIQIDQIHGELMSQGVFK